MSEHSKKQRLYFTAFSDVVQPRSETIGSPQQVPRLAKLPDRKGVFAEALLFSDQVVFDIGGPNLVLPVLLRFFQYKTLLQLIEEDIIHFSFCPGSVAYFSNANMKAFNVSGNPGLHRFIAAGLEFSDPFESAECALREQTKLNREQRRQLAMAVSRNTVVLPAERIFAEAFRLADADKSSQLGIQLGFTSEDDPIVADFPQTKVHQYLDLAHHNISYLSMALSKCEDIVAEQLAYKVLENRVVVKPQFQDIVRVTHAILDFENLPDIRQMVAQSQLSLSSVLKIRKSKHLIEFRDWLRSTPSVSDTEAIKAYVATVEERISNKPLYKLLKIGIFTGAGGIIGSIGGPVGAGLGAIATNALLGFTDTFFIDKLVDGWNPKIFIEKEIKSRLSEET
jgi:hypothetical protein